MSMHDELRGIDRKQISEHLDAQLSALDAATVDRLNRDRRRALAQLETRPKAPRISWIAGAALAGVGALTLWPSTRTAHIPPAPVSMETFAALASPDQAEVIESLDFYLWAEGQDVLDEDQAG